MINTKPFCYYGLLLHQEEAIPYYDFETGGLDREITQPLEIAAVMIDPRKLEIIKDSLYHSMIKPLDDEEAIKKGLEPVQRSALAKNNISLASLENAPDEKTVFQDFVKNYLYKYNVKKDSWNAPIPAGFNIDNFDKYIIDRCCKAYGFWDVKKKQQKIFNPVQSIDLKNITFLLNENNPEVERNSFDCIRDWLGLSKEGAHSAKVDVLQGAEIFCKFMRFIRHWVKMTDFRGSK